jgi:hypothetical protein
MDEAVRELLGRRRNRSIAIILTEKEIQCDPHVPEDASRKFRKVVLDQMNDFHDFCVDMIESFDTGGVVMNQMFLDRLEEIYDYIQDIEDADDY